MPFNVGIFGNPYPDFVFSISTESHMAWHYKLPNVWACREDNNMKFMKGGGPPAFHLVTALIQFMTIHDL
ncbi:hypothetical protein D3C84_398190 [compost metagenome]